MTDLLAEIPAPVLLVFSVAVIGVLLVILGRLIGDYRDPQRRINQRFKRQEKARLAEEKRQLKEQERQAKALAKLEKTKQEVADKPPPTPNAPITPNAPSALEEEPIGEFVNFEIGKEKKGRRVTVVRGRIKVRPDRFGRIRDKFLFQWDKGGYFVRLDKLIEVEVKKGFRGKKVDKVRKLVYDVLYSEPLEQDGSVMWDDQLEEILTDAGAGQYIDAASQEGGFQLTPALVRALIVVGLLGTFLGLALNGTVHVTPITQIHWVP